MSAAVRQFNFDSYVQESTYLMQDQIQVQAVVQKPVKYIENYWGQDVRVDRSKVDLEQEMAWWPKFGVDRMNVGSLPFATSPRYRKNVEERIVPEETRMHFSRSCWNECLNQSGPWMLRHWQIWDYAPFLPTNGDVSLDPKYGSVSTKQFTQQYKVRFPGTAPNPGLGTSGLPMYGIGGRNVPL